MSDAKPTRPRHPFVRIKSLSGLNIDTTITLVVLDEDGREIEHELPVARMEFVLDARSPQGSTCPLRLYVVPSAVEVDAAVEAAMISMRDIQETQDPDPAAPLPVEFRCVCTVEPDGDDVFHRCARRINHGGRHAIKRDGEVISWEITAGGEPCDIRKGPIPV